MDNTNENISNFIIYENMFYITEIKFMKPLLL